MKKKKQPFNKWFGLKSDHNQRDTPKRCDQVKLRRTKQRDRNTKRNANEQKERKTERQKMITST
jgi:hypothetical protein